MPGNDTASTTVKHNPNIFEKNLYIKMFLESKGANYLDNLGVSFKEIKLVSSWLNEQGRNQTVGLHNHRSVKGEFDQISGVFYVKVPKNGGNIRFQRPGYDSFNCIWPDKKDNSLFLEMDETNSPEWWMPSMNNILYLFPSWLSHWVEPNLNKKENRISISFNMV